MSTAIACGQLECELFDLGANLAKAERFIRRAAAQGARLVLLPELMTTGYAYDRRLMDLAEPLGGETTRWMRRLSIETGAWIGAGIAERCEGQVFDSFVLTGPAGELHIYRKRHPAFFEKMYFHQGSEIGIFETSLGRIGVMICWDMVQNRLAREMAGQIDLLLICSAWPDVRTGNLPLFGVRKWLGSRPEVQPRRLAQQLRVPVAYCNMTGDFVTRVPGLGLTYRSAFAGASSIIDGRGQVLSAVQDEETVIVAHIPLGHGQRRRAA
jgi:predicted amidohydrolase